MRTEPNMAGFQHDPLAGAMKILLAVACTAAALGQTSQYDGAEWQNPAVFGVNKLPPRNSAWPNPDAASGWKSDYDTSP